jgi:DNA polymerase-3 subunit alpha (Gram-positive type)
LEEILRQYIDWEAAAKERPGRELSLSVDRAVVLRGTAALSVDVSANFRIPEESLAEARRHMLAQVEGLEDVAFNISYVGEGEGEARPAGAVAGDGSASGVGPASGVGSGRPKGAAKIGRAPAVAAGKAATGGRRAGTSVFGKAIAAGTAITPISALAEDKSVVVEGDIFAVNVRDVFDQGKKKLAGLLITDYENSACVKILADGKTWGKLEGVLAPGAAVRVAGVTAMDYYDHEIIIRARGVEKLAPVARTDSAPEKRVELHAHTKMSAMDGLAEVSKLVALAARFGHKAVAITDHGVAQAFPEAAKAGEKAGIKIIYGLEGYLLDNGVPGRSDRKQYKTGQTSHVILLARDAVGLKNLYKLVSLSHMEYFYKKPRIPKSLLLEYREGLLIGSACVAGQVYQAVKDGASEAETERLLELYDYLEIQPLANNAFLVDKGYVQGVNELMEINRRIVDLGRKYGKPVAATCDSHYLEKHEAKYRNVLLAGQGYKDLEGDNGLYFRTTEEMLEEFAYLGAETAFEVVVKAPAGIADMVEPIRPVPKGKFPPKIANSDEILRSSCLETAWELYGRPLPGPVQERLDRELNSIISNNYAVMYVSAQKLVKKSLEDGYLVGSRGSVGSSLAAAMAGITEVNPLPPHYICPNPDCRRLEWGDAEAYGCGADMPARDCPNCGARFRQEGFNIPFETFLGFEGDKEPDIDLNFAGEYQTQAHKYVEELFGKQNVFRAGTISTIKSKTAYGFVRKFHEEQGIPVNKWEVERLTEACTDVRRTTGQHPGGIIIVPEGHEIYEFCPIQRPANDAGSDVVTTHFDYHSIDENLLKLDILGHDVPSMIKRLQDLTGVDPLSVPLNDERVNSIFNGIEGLDIKAPRYAFSHGSYGIPEFGTRFVRQMLDVTKPRKLSDLVRISGFSHGTDVWTNNAHELIKSGKAAMDEAISTRDDIMNYLISKGVPDGDSFKIMENVRKGKGVTDAEAGMLRAHGVPEWYVESCRRIKYMFPKAHAVAYVLMSYRIAYYKAYYPLAFYAAYFTAAIDNFDVATALLGLKAALDKVKLVEAKGKNATKKEQDEATVLEVVYEMYARGYELLPPDVSFSDSCDFAIEDGKLRAPLAALQGVGVNAARGIKEAFDASPFISVDDLRVRAKVNKTALEALSGCGALSGLPESNQISFFGELG